MNGLLIRGGGRIDNVRMLNASTVTRINYYLNDHLGTPQRLLDEKNDVSWQASYEAFGAATVTTSVVEQNHRFPGQYYDVESGLHYNWNRYYDAGVGRYVTSDPIGLDGGLNTFAYVGGNPLKWVDQKGLSHGSMYDPVSGYVGGEAHFGVGGGFTYLTCSDKCGNRRTMIFVKVCLGLAAGASAGAGFVGGMEGDGCTPEKYEGFFGELGASIGPVGGSIDIGNGVWSLVEQSVEGFKLGFVITFMSGINKYEVR